MPQLAPTPGQPLRAAGVIPDPPSWWPQDPLGGGSPVGIAPGFGDHYKHGSPPPGPGDRLNAMQIQHKQAMAAANGQELMPLGRLARRFMGNGPQGAGLHGSGLHQSPENLLANRQQANAIARQDAALVRRGTLTTAGPPSAENPGGTVTFSLPSGEQRTQAVWGQTGPEDIVQAAQLAAARNAATPGQDRRQARRAFRSYVREHL